MTIPHGTTGGYTNHLCRCSECRAVWAAYCRKRKTERDPAKAPHGTMNGYHNYCCRCAECRAAHATYVRGLRARRKAAA